MVCRKPKRPEWRFFVLLCPEMWRPKGRHKFLTVQGGATAPLAPPLGSALARSPWRRRRCDLLESHRYNLQKTCNWSCSISFEICSDLLKLRRRFFFFLLELYQIDVDKEHNGTQVQVGEINLHYTIIEL